MTADEMRRAAVLLDNAAYSIDVSWLVGSNASHETIINARRALAAKLRAMADVAEQRESWTKQDKD